jgi:peptidyl-tRNA hydrolase, PTH1 family
MRIIVGLGNPGPKYQKTRHNAGFMALDIIAKQAGEKWTDSTRFQAQQCRLGADLLIKPQTFMNESGRSVRAAADYYKLTNEDMAETLIVFHDDLDIAMGSYKVSVDSRSAGHNGVQSIIDHLGTKNFTRVRLGIARTNKDGEGCDYVLAPFSADEQVALEQAMATAIKDIE